MGLLSLRYRTLAFVTLQERRKTRVWYVSIEVGTIQNQVHDHLGNTRANITLKDITIIKRGFKLFSICTVEGIELIL